ncbi:hypothetical protein LWI29_016782 [Acer saccharum]|uniref:CCHC-type domain-containing protein n=1 Tax=Acer saccharum TaxID=4024 RepID=A0AA39VBV3_ACESA|nr:hypothetical protein LWI29_016782 [Acer saccharum]
MSAWLDLQLVKSEQNLETIVREFVSRFTGSLRDWYQALGEYRQLQFVRVPLASQAMGYIFREFLSDPDHLYKQARQEFFDMRCCSLKRKDIEFHYKRMSQWYHTLGGINDHSLKQIKCKSLDSCTCKTKKKNHFKHFKNKKGSSKRFKFFRKKAKRGWNKSQRCYICGKPGHFAKKCPNKKAKSARLVQQLKDIADEVPSDADIESIFSEQDKADHTTTFVLQEDLSDSEYSGSSDYNSIPESYQATQLISHAGPQAPVRILPDKYSKPVDVIAYFDTDFPDSNLSVKQVQQFLGIVNYVRDFIPHVSRYTSVLSTLLKKRPPPWNSTHIEAVIKLKEISQSHPALTIPSSGQLILQTDASDIFWGAVLIEDRDSQRRYCGHGSGKFTDAQQHFHTIYKEILAVKYGIQKLDFHLRTRNFIVEMDNSSFPKILDFRNKIPPNPLLLRLKDWFARYDFTVRHVKGHHNIIADMLSRPPLTHLITPTCHYPLIFMTSPTGPSSSSLDIPNYSFPPELMATLLPNHQPSLDQIQTFAKAHLPVYLFHINSQDCRHTINNLSRPFLDPFIMPPFYYFSHQLLWFLWCLSVLHHHAIVFPLQALYGHLHDHS